VTGSRKARAACRKDQQRRPCLRLGVLVLGTLLLAVPAPAAMGSGPPLTLTKSVVPSSVVSGGRVTYTIRVASPGSEATEGIAIQDVLPAGFVYQPGSGRVTVNGVAIPLSPTQTGNVLTWSGLSLPSGRSASPYGIHTFVQSRWNPCDRGFINDQLDRAHDLMGDNGYVTQLFDWIEPNKPVPSDCWRDFVNGAYDRKLTPVVRLAGPRGQKWIKPSPDPDGSYTTWVQAFKGVVQNLPKRDGFYLYVQIWNEPNVDEEWEGTDPLEYGRFLRDCAAAIRSLGDPHVRILNAPLSPGGNYPYLAYLEAMLSQVPTTRDAFDVWASHPYSGNRPPSLNVHDGTAPDNNAAIDLYQRELEVLARHGRGGVQVLLTETGYALDDGFDVSLPRVSEDNRADYIVRAFRDYWRQWPEVIGVCPYELLDPQGTWWRWDWLGHRQYDAVRAMDKSSPPVSSILKVAFEVTAPESPGQYVNQVTLSASSLPAPLDASSPPLTVFLPTPTRTVAPSATPTASRTATPSPSLTQTPTGVPPQTLTATPITGATVTATPTSSPGCHELIANGGFEARQGWTWSSDICPAAYDDTTVARSGTTSMRVGIASGSNPSRCFSTVWQELTIPAQTDAAWLDCWYRYSSTDTSGDLGYISIYDGETGGELRRLLTIRSDAPVWQHGNWALDNSLLGRRVRIAFGVSNDGDSDVSSMNVDDVSVVQCVEPPISTPLRAFLPLILRHDGPQPEQAPGSRSSPMEMRTLWRTQDHAALPEALQAVAFNQRSARLYVAADRVVWELDTQTGRILARTELDGRVRDVAVDAYTGRVYVSLWDAGALAIVDAALRAVVRVVPNIPGASGIAIGENVVYVAATESDELAVVDSRTGGIIKRIPVGKAPYAVACDEGSGQRIFVGNAGDETLSIVDAGSGAVVRIVKLGGLGHPHGLAFDAVRQRIYVTYAFTPKYGAIAAVDASTGQVLKRLTGSYTRSLFAAYAIAVDPSSGAVYVNAADETLELAGETLQVLSSFADVGPASTFGADFDPVAGRLYVAEQRQGRLAVSDE
jgi:uncharacterized repeat protein (TIGR01451 family)